MIPVEDTSRFNELERKNVEHYKKEDGSMVKQFSSDVPLMLATFTLIKRQMHHECTRPVVFESSRSARGLTSTRSLSKGKGYVPVLKR